MSLLPPQQALFRRLKKFFTFPIYIIWRKLLPENYARHIGVRMGKRCRIYGSVNWSTEPYMIKIGDDCHITNGVSFIAHDGAVLLFRNENPDLELISPITLGDRVYVGLNATIMQGVTIGNDVIIGAGAIVTKDIPSGSVAVGIPARVIKTTGEYLEKAKLNSVEVGSLSASEKKFALRRKYHIEKR